MRIANKLLSLRMLQDVILLLVLIAAIVNAQDDKACSADGTCKANGYEQFRQQGQQQQQQQQQQGQQQQANGYEQFRQQGQQQQGQQQQQQQQQAFIVETVNVEFGEPQVVLNHETEPTRLNIRQTQQYISSHASWKSTCLNRHQLCSFWAAIGECQKNDWMRDNCAPSCRNCPLPDSGPRPQGGQEQQQQVNYNGPHNITWDHISVAIFHGEAQIVPTVNSDPVVQMIAKMTKYMQTEVMIEEKYAKVREECKLKDSRCSIWAAEGECDKNPSYMKTACAPACGTCEQISYEYRCPYDKKAPTALNPGDVDSKFNRIVKGFAQYSPTILSSPFNAKKGPWVIQLENFSTPEECQRLIELGAQVGYSDSRTVGKTYADGSVEAVVADRIRTSKNAWCEEPCEDDPLVAPLWDRIEQLVEIPKNNSEYLQLLRYEESQFYGTHHDYLEHHVDRPQGVRILTLFLYLNDVEEGGETEFPHLGLAVRPKQGRAVLWPSVLNEAPNVKDFRTEHGALPVKKGVKYGANAWLHQRDYRIPHHGGCT